jgi:hypothetical protein
LLTSFDSKDLHGIAEGIRQLEHRQDETQATSMAVAQDNALTLQARSSELPELQTIEIRMPRRYPDT